MMVLKMKAFENNFNILCCWTFNFPTLISIEWIVVWPSRWSNSSRRSLDNIITLYWFWSCCNNCSRVNTTVSIRCWKSNTIISATYQMSYITKFCDLLALHRSMIELWLYGNKNVIIWVLLLHILKGDAKKKFHKHF